MTTRNQNVAARRWRRMIEAEHEQSDRVRDLTEGDQWRPFAGRFRPPSPSAIAEEPQFQAIASHVQPHQTLLDVGAGGGRLAIPLAQRCAHVTAVEPSESMADNLQNAAAEAGVADKITLVSATWEEAQVEPADIVLCSHVMYTVADVIPFVRKLEEHARQRVVVVLFADPPIASARPFWEHVYQEERLQLPGLPYFVRVLWEEGIYPDVQMLAPRRGGRFNSRDEARDNFRARLYIQPGSDADARLEAAMDDLLISEPEGDAVRIRDARRQRPGLITWVPAHASG